MDLNEFFNLMYKDLISKCTNDDCPAEVFIKLSNLSASNAAYYLELGLKNPNLNPDTIRELFKYNGPNLRSALCANAKIPDDMLDEVLTIYTVNKLIYNMNLSKSANYKILKWCIDNKVPKSIERIIISGKIDIFKILDKTYDIGEFLGNIYDIDEGIKPNKIISKIKSFISSLNKSNLMKAYELVKDNEAFLIPFIESGNSYINISLLKEIYRDHGSDKVYEALAKPGHEMDRELFEELISLDNKNVIKELVFSPLLDTKSIVHLIKRYRTDEDMFSLLLNRLKNNIDHLNQYAFNDLLNLNEERIDLILANIRERNYGNSEDVYKELLKRGNEKVYSVLAKNNGINNVGFFKFIIAMRTKSLDTFSNCVISLEDYYTQLYILSKTKMYSKLLLTHHPLAKDVSKIVNSRKVMDSASKLQFMDKFNMNTPNNRFEFNAFKRMIEDSTDYKITHLSSNTSLIKKSDRISYVEDTVVIVPDFDNLETIIHNLDLNKEKNVVYGSYPLYIVNPIDSACLDSLYIINKLNKTNKRYSFLYKDVVYDLQEYTFNNRRFVKLKDMWIEVDSLKWKVNKRADILELMDEIPFLKDNKNIDEFLLHQFKSCVFEPYIISEEDMTYKKEEEAKKSSPKFKAKEIKKVKEDSEKANEEKYKEIVSLITELQKSLNELEGNRIISSMKLRHLLSSITVPDEDLIVKVDDHYEFRKEFIPILKYIDLSMVETKNLKLSGLDLRETNLRFNPQEIYNKDLSDSLLSDNNVVWASFKGVNLKGSNIEDEQESFDIELAIIDERTKLPKIKKAKSL